MVGTTSEIEDTDYDKFVSDLSPVSDGSSERINTGTRVDDKYNIFNDNSSLLGVIVDRSSFDEDDELTTYGRDSASVFHGRQARLNLPLHKDRDSDLPLGGIVMRNGKVRRKMRWKPRFRKKNSSNQFSSNASVMSALTNRSSATSRSSSTTRSFLSHFSRKSNTSFHTFHSTATPVATNKANGPRAPHTVMRPNYQDSFETIPTTPRHATIDTEGKYMQRQGGTSQFSDSSALGFQSTKLDSVIESSPSEDVEVNRSSSFSLSDREGKKTNVNIIPTSDSKTNGIKAINVTTSSNNSVGATSAISAMSKENSANPPIPSTIKSTKSTLQQQSKPRRPPLFKRRLRYNKNKSSNNVSTNNNSNSSQNVSSPTDTNSTASLSSAISLERENSGLPVLTGDEQDRRVEIDITRSLFTDCDEDSPTKPLRALEASKTSEDPAAEEGREENSVSPTVQSSVSGSQSGSQSASSGALSRDTTPISLQKRISSISKNRSTSSTSISTASPKQDSSTGGSIGSPPSPGLASATNSFKSKFTGRNTTISVPVDLNEETFLKAEHNLRAIHEMAAEHLAHSEYEEAADVFEEILRGQQERYGQDHYRVGTALHNLGIVYLKKGDYMKAIEICQRAVDVRKDSLVPNHPDVAVSLSQLAVAHLESRNYHEALAAFQDALKIRRNFLGPRHMKCSKILNNIGCALYSIENLSGAKRAFEEALDIQRQGLRNLPTMEGSESNDISNCMQTNTLLLSMASTLCNIGSIRLRWGDFEKADFDLEEALLVRFILCFALYFVHVVFMKKSIEYLAEESDIPLLLFLISKIQQSVLGDEHPIVNSTLDSIKLVETAKHCAANPQSYNVFLKTAAAACTVESPTNVMTEILGMGTFEEGDWFLNPCAPVSYNHLDHD